MVDTRPKSGLRRIDAPPLTRVHPTLSSRRRHSRVSAAAYWRLCHLAHQRRHAAQRKIAAAHIAQAGALHR